MAYDGWRLRRSSMIRLASATSSSALLFSKLEGLSGKGRFESGEKMDALQPLPTRLTSTWYPLYSMGVTLKGRCAGRIWPGTRQRWRCSRSRPTVFGLPLKCRLRARRAPAPQEIYQDADSRDSRQNPRSGSTPCWQHFAPNSANRRRVKFDPC